MENKVSKNRVFRGEVSFFLLFISPLLFFSFGFCFMKKVFFLLPPSYSSFFF